jgi:ribosomal protein S18 acetylase RimI-like enzyme
MWRVLDGPLPDASWPDGVVVRTYSESDGPAVKTLLDDAYAAWDAEYVPREYGEWERWMTDHDEFDPGLWFLVERDGELVACALLWKVDGGRGWVKDLVVREDQRGRGLATALLHHAFGAYQCRGAERVGLKVDSRNPTGAPQLYERVGFVADT